MNARTGISRQVRLVTAMLLVLVVLMPGTLSPASARVLSTRQADASEVEIRFEGYVKAIGPGKWLIGTQSVLVDSSTTIIEKRGQVEVGAWVVVWASLLADSSVRASIISVEQPAGQSGPTYQFSGIITKQFTTMWIVDELLVKITPQTQIIGTPGVGWLAWVVAEDDGDGLRGLVIEAIAGDPADLPVEFEGPIEAFAADQWRVDGQDVTVSAITVFLGAPPAVGLIAEVQAMRDAAGLLNAHMIRVLDPAGPATVLASAEGVIQARARTPADPSQTWAADWTDQRKVQSTAGPDTLATATPDTGTTTHPWSDPTAIARGLPDAARPAIAYSADGVAHALWEVKGQIYYAAQRPGQAWSAPQRIATGAAPVLLAGGTGPVHALFHNEFFGNYDIYHLILQGGKWSLPINIARTSGTSLNPTLAIDKTGILRAAWMDNTPGYWTIYTGYYDGTFWRNYPVPNARGQKAAIATAPSGTIFLAWQDRVPTAADTTGTFDIFISQHQNGTWSLPINVSSHPGVEATDVSVTATADSMAHLTWIAGGRTVMYCTGRDLYWPVPQTVVQATSLARGPRIVAEKGKFLHIAWDEGDVVRATAATAAPPAWPKPQIIAWPAGNLKDVALTEALGKGVTVGWVDVTLPNDAGIFASTQASSIPARAWLPLISSY